LNATSKIPEETQSETVVAVKGRPGRKPGVPQGPRTTMDRTTYLKIADQEKQVFEKQLLRLSDIVGCLKNATDFSPSVSNLLQKFLDDSSSMTAAARNLLKVIRKRGQTALDEELEAAKVAIAAKKKALANGTLRLVKPREDDE
jgi:hypothetical protein